MQLVQNILQTYLIFPIEKVEHIPFLYLTCDLPAPPLYPDELQENIIPQVPIYNILNKFCGFQEKEYKTYKDSTLKRFELTKLPPFIILFIKVLFSIGRQSSYAKTNFIRWKDSLKSYAVDLCHILYKVFGDDQWQNYRDNIYSVILLV